MNQPAPQSASHVTTTPLTFTQLISSTRRGARLARLLSVDQMRSWGAPQDLAKRAEIVVAELAAKAVLHGSLPGRSFRLTLTFDTAPGRLRVDVTDSRGDMWPLVRPASVAPDASLPTSGRGLSLVAAIADRWDTLPYPPSGKIVRAKLVSPS